MWETKDLVGLGIVIFGIVLCALGVLHEYREWNGGFCKETGEPWEYFDTDSQGGRGYKSSTQTIWVSWPVDKRRKQK
jgi:hypothetical protein